MVAIAFLLAICLPTLLITAGHYFPWIKLKGSELSRPQAYAYGVASINGTAVLLLVLLEVLSCPVSTGAAALLVATCTLSAGATTVALYLLDHALETRHRLMDAEEKLDARR